MRFLLYFFLYKYIQPLGSGCLVAILTLIYIEMQTFNRAIAIPPHPDSPPTPDAEQITSVSQLRDVEVTDWAFQALQSLVERYGCIAGYPNSTFRGDRPLSRYEFSSGLNACIERIQELVTQGAKNQVSKADLLTIQKLQTEFASELSTLKGRSDALATRTAQLEPEQFSTTTKLNASVWFNLTGAIANGNVKFESVPNVTLESRVAGRDSAGKPLVQNINGAQTVLSGLTWLSFTTSFTGKDTLVTQLVAGNGISPVNQFVSAGFFGTYGNPYTEQSPGQVAGIANVLVQDFYYKFPLTKSVQLTVGPQINWFNHFDFNRFTSFLTGAGSYVSADTPQSAVTYWGSGAVLEWAIGPKFRFAGGYLGENIPYLSSALGYNTASNPSFGLFGGTNSATSELTYSPSNQFNLRLRYTYSRLQAYGGQIGGNYAAPLPYGYLDAGPGFSVFDPNTGGLSSGGLDWAYANTLAVNFDWLIAHHLGIFGRYSYGNINLKPIDQTVNVESFQMGLGFPDLGKRGAQGVITFVAPMDILHGRQYFVSGGGDGSSIYELEGTYYYPLRDNLALVPAFYAIFHPNNFNDNPNIYVGNLRLQFSF